MQYRLIAILICLFIINNSFCAFSQTIYGKVLSVADSGTENLPYASVYWLNTSIGTYTDSLGEFEIPLEGVTDRRLVVEMLGYLSDTIEVTDDSYLLVRLQPNVEVLSEVIIESEERGFYDPVKSEVIGQADLSKSACCDLAGCFETQATVQPMTTNIITNSKELRILGLSGVYNQVLIDGMPLIQGLSYTYGFSGLPGTLVDKIYVAKGANSVLQGYESITGSINVLIKQPENTNKALLNAYVNSFGERQLNLNYSKRFKDWNTLGAVHLVRPAFKIDRDKDGFLDVPQIRRFMIYNKWTYRREVNLGWSSMIGFRFLNEERTGGQKSFDRSEKGNTSIYGQVVKMNQPEIYTKSGYRFSENSKITLISSAFVHDQNSYFGNLSYQARQYNAYGNIQYELSWNRKHDLKTGVSLRYLNLEENLTFNHDALGRTYDGRYFRKEVIPGIFAENTFRWRGDKIALITGVRLDKHNAFGYFFTPRTQLKYEFTQKLIARVSAGTGWRTVNLLSENINLLASSRDIIITEELNPEKAFNWGINLTQKFRLGDMTGTLSADFYQTKFSNQIFPDYDSDPTKAYISNFTGTSVSNGFQIEGNLDFLSRFTTKLAYTYLDVYRIYGESKGKLPFIPNHKILGSLSYSPLSKGWHADVNLHWFGKQRLPYTFSNPEEYRRPERSESYTILNAQFSKTWKKFEVYVGCENIFDFRQLYPILGWQDPFGPYFDSSFAWGPTRGREFYAGIRFRIL